MKTITVIDGIDNSEKSCLAEKITKDSNYVRLKYSDLGNAFSFMDVSKYTEFIIIDDVPMHRINDCKNAFRYDKLIVERRGENPISMPMPHVVLIAIR